MFDVRLQGAVSVLGGDSPLVVSTIEDAARLVNMITSVGQPRLVFDFSRIPLIDSSGLEFLLDLRDQILERGGTVNLAAVSPLVQEILRVTGLAAEFAIYDDVIRAVGSFAK